ncbi:unnamed protein product [Symbiodinium necroappetens]|uniref:RNA polymerase Rpb4/RPC9 core domain-containing protein n=1 Tax=Symbiodinium necroappetens TaxID=1628268 RepID=A0A812TVB0_9DINO|nr:unnamed protein product [Symbiodinium necroappetens]CAE7779907.1 unnamed protein product [Symbiodinium microadriaticum]CAE7872855.1 unnamed protein product [Symbiodinium sp. KB8]|mmetsp:Transcript_68723/g.163704  ORF Transcript_68723/g.163704 Transcript_68723/m.163704 type:complete len:149 (+) Transcript_68723:60-506(+)
MSGEADLDAARVDKEGHIMLGPWRKREGIHLGHLEMQLQQLQAQRTREKRPLTEEAKKVMEYCKRFKPLTNESQADKVKKQMTGLHLQRNSRKLIKRCRDFEATQLFNLMPATPDEARKLIPTLEGNHHLDDLLEELSALKKYDRSVQ